MAVTLHRLTSSMLLLAFGITKAVLGYKGNVIAGTTLDWLVGILLTLVYGFTASIASLFAVLTVPSGYIGWASLNGADLE